MDELNVPEATIVASLDERGARMAAEAAVAERDALRKLSDADRKVAEVHASSAQTFQRAARDAFDRGEVRWFACQPSPTCLHHAARSGTEGNSC